ncbi:MAG: hypothetical protein PHT80_11740 [Lentisphaeria bacterium]|nr:hypothetical protein [Lentisphaeria bacterium]
MTVLLGYMLSAAAWADTLTAGGKRYSGMFAGYAKGRVQFQEWTATEPLQMELRRVERLKIAKPSPVKYTLSGAPKKTLTAPFLGIKNGAFLFADGADELRYFSRQIGRIEVKIDYQAFMAEAQQAAGEGEGGDDQDGPLRARDMVVDNQVTVIHFHHDGSAASTRQGNLAQRLCEDSRGTAAYVRVLVKDGDDPVAKANKLRSLPQFWFYDRRGELSGKLAERFTEEDISKAFEEAHKGR